MTYLGWVKNYHRDGRLLHLIAVPGQRPRFLTDAEFHALPEAAAFARLYPVG